MCFIRFYRLVIVFIWFLHIITANLYEYHNQRFIIRKHGLDFWCIRVSKPNPKNVNTFPFNFLCYVWHKKSFLKTYFYIEEAMASMGASTILKSLQTYTKKLILVLIGIERFELFFQN